MNTEGNGYTFLFSTVMVVLVATALAFAATALKPAQDANIKKEKMQYILRSFGMKDISREDSPEAYKNFIKSELVLDNNGKEIGKEGFAIDLAKEKGKHPVFIAEKDGQKFYVLPVRGMGLWDAIWAYVAVDENLTVKGIVFDHKAETPGLGGDINTAFFEDRFMGEDIFDSAGIYQGLSVVKSYKGGDLKTDGQVDGLSGATLTCNGVTTMLVDGMKPYEEYLKSVKK
jgi:Na+-transporting NADH:ubiquinone oxidoreductase subunit C